MAEQIVRQVIDDIDGSLISDSDGERIEFSVRGATYRIDLSKTNVAKFDKALKPYIDAGTKLSGRGGRTNKSKTSRNGSGSGERMPAIRAWARQNGHEVSERGRIKTALIEAFEAAH